MWDNKKIFIYSKKKLVYEKFVIKFYIILFIFLEIYIKLVNYSIFYVFDKIIFLIWIFNKVCFWIFFEIYVE